MGYRIIGADNFRPDEDEAYQVSEHATAEAAVAEAKRRIDGDLRHLHKQNPGQSAKELVSDWLDFGESVGIQASGGSPSIEFSSLGYVKERAATIA
jgi:hypothetical protein